jgi:hypothetical protein
MDDRRFGYITKLEKKALAQSVLISSQAFEGAHYILGRLLEKPNDSVTLFDIFCSIFQIGKAAQLEASSCWHGTGHIEMQVEMLTAQIRCC